MRKVSGALLLVGIALLPSCGLLGSGSSESEVSSETQVPQYRSFCIDKTPRDSDHLVVGVGVGESLPKARQQAMSEIAQKLSSRVSVTTKSTTRAIDDYESETFDQDVSIETDVAIDDAVELCRDVDDPRGKVYVVYQLDKRPLVQKVYSDLAGRWQGDLPQTVHFKGPSMLVGSHFVSELREKLERQAGTQEKTVVIDLKRRNNRWVLSVNDSANYTVADRKFLSFIAPDFRGAVKALDIDIASGDAPRPPSDFRFARSVRLKHGDDFHFWIASRRSGYFSLFNIYEDGRIANLLENRFIQNGSALQYPEGGTFTSLVLEDGKSTYDVYIGVLTENPIVLSEFAKLENQGGFLAGDDYYQFDQFLRWFDFVDPIGVSTLEARTDP